MGFFPVDEKTIEYFKGTGRTKSEIQAFEAYFKAQRMFGVPKAGEIDYSQVVTLDLGKVAPSLAGPKRPQDRIEIGHVAGKFDALFSAPIADNGFNLPADQLAKRHLVQQDGPEALQPESKPLPADARAQQSRNGEQCTQDAAKAEASAIAAAASLAVKPHEKSFEIGSGDVLIAAITSCTNTSNPSVMLAAGLLAKKAVEAGLKVKPHIKTSLAPGSRLVTKYLTEAGLLPYLEKLGFALAGYGCTTCIGNAGDLTPEINAAITQNNLVCAARALGQSQL